MKELKKVARLKPIKSSKSAKVLSFVQEPQRIIEKQTARIESLEERLIDLLIRDEEKREADIKKEINYLSKVDTNYLPIYVLNTYNTTFFLSECDSDFKMELARMIIEYMEMFFPGYRNPLLEEVAEGTSRYAANYIYTL